MPPGEVVLLPGFTRRKSCVGFFLRVFRLHRFLFVGDF